jgi:formamidopyrimidine-DNA glycosylase
MPELPEVEIFRRYVETNALDQTVRQVEVLKSKILESVTEAQLQNALKGHRFDETKRHGKYLFLHVDKTDSWVVFHFGMTGFLQYSDKPVPITEQTEMLGKKKAHVRVRIEFENGASLAFDELRMFGKMGFAEDLDAYLQKRKLGKDALEISKAEFREALLKRKGQIKPALMDQSLVAGPGNVYVDEMLFQCKIHPEALIKTLSQVDADCLYEQMVSILKKTIEAKAVRKKLPAGYLTHSRKKNGQCPRDKTDLEIITVGGRTTYFCPVCQK